MHRLVALAAALAAVVLACSDRVAPTNPYDPATPPEQQAKGQIRGTLLVSGAGAAVDVTVFLRKNGQLARQTTTASDGAFLLDGVVPGSYTLEVSPTGFVPLTLPLTVAPGERIDTGRMALTAAAAASVIEGTATLAGAVDSGGTLVEAVGRAYTAVTNSQGQFHLDLPEGTYDLRLSHKDYVTLTVAAVAVARGETRVLDAVSLPSNPATIAGHVDAELAGGGTGPLVDATVTLEGTALTGLTNAAGDFALTGVPPGSYVLRVLKSGYSQTAAPLLDLAGGETRSLPDPFTLSLLRGGLRGAVALADTSDASGIVVEVAGTSRATVTGSDGVFAFDGLLTGAYALSAHKDGYTRRDLGSWTVSAGAVTAVSPAPPAVLTPLGGAVAVGEGPYVSARGVHLTVASGGGFYRAAERPQALPAGWTAVPAGGQIPFQLSDVDGEHVIDVVFSADGVTAGAPTFAAVVLDRQRPSSPTLAIGDGSGYTRAPGGIVSLALSALDLPPAAGAAVSGVARMQLSNDAAFTAPETRDYALTATWTLASPSSDGPKTVYVRFLDRAGNVSDTASASVVLDRVAPASPSLALAGPLGSPAGYTSSTSVAATLSASDANGPLLARLSNTPGFEGARYQPFASTAAWTLLPGDGAKTVYAQFMDPAGNESLAVPASITLDSAPPSSPVVTLTERDARPTNGFTSVRTVDLALSAGGQPTAAQVSEDPTFATGVTPVTMAGLPQPVAVPFTLSHSGLVTVYVRFTDLAGNWSATASAQVTIDDFPLAAPSLTLGASLADGTPSPGGTPVLAGSPVVMLGLSGTDDAVEMTTAQGSACASAWPAAWFPLAASSIVQLTPPDGERAVCARIRDAAGNESAIGAVRVELDTTPPSNPAFSDLRTTVTRATAVTGTLVAAAADPDHAPETVSYQCFTTLTGIWGPCTGTAPVFTFPLARNAPNVIGIRARDAARNVSAGTLVSVVQDDVPPLPPNLTGVETSADSITVTWQPGADADVDHFLLYYGNAPGDFAGTGAAQGPSPILVAASGGTQDFSLTGLDTGGLYYVAVEAVDRAGNGSGPSGQRVAAPNRVNPRLISNYGARARSIGVLVERGTTYAYVPTNQGLLQLDATDPATAPSLMSAAVVPNVVPDVPPAILPCNLGGARVHCVVMAGTTLDQAYLGNGATERAAAPVIVFPPEPNTFALQPVVSVLPARPVRVLSGTINGASVLYAIERTRIVAFDLSDPAFPRTLGAVPLAPAMTSILGAGLVGDAIYLFGGSAGDPSGPPRLREITIAGSPAFGMTAADRGALLDRFGQPLARAGTVNVLPVFEGGLFVATVEATQGQATQGVLCSYVAGIASPQSCAVIADSSGELAFDAASVGNGHVDVAIFDNCCREQRYQVNRAALSGTQVTAPLGTAPLVLRSGADAEAVALTGTPGRESLFVLEHGARIARVGGVSIEDGALRRWTIDGANAAHATPAYDNARPTTIAESDRYVFTAEDERIDAVDLGDPLTPTVRSNPRPGYAYGKLVAVGRYLYAAAIDPSGAYGIDVLAIDGDGGLTPAAWIGLPGEISDFTVSGRWLFVGVGSTVSAFDVARKGAIRPAGSLTGADLASALAAAPITSGGRSTTVLVVERSRLSVYGYDGASFALVSRLPSSAWASGALAVTMQGPLAVISGQFGASVVDLSAPAAPKLRRSSLPVAKPVVQSGYLVGMGRLQDPGGPVFYGYAGDGAEDPAAPSAGIMDGTSPFSGCVDLEDGSRSVVHWNGVYVLNCGDNGLTVFSAADGRPPRLLGRYDLASGGWAGSGGALAVDGYASYMGATAGASATDPTVFYAAANEPNAAGKVTEPQPVPSASAGPVRQAPVHLLAQGGLLWSFEREETSTNTRGAIRTFEIGDPLKAWTLRAAGDVAGFATFSARPVSDGDRIYVARKDTIEVYDARDPSLFSVTPLATRSVTATGQINSLAISRERLYVGVSSYTEGPQIAVLDTRTLALRPLSPIAVDSPATYVLGMAISGSTFFYTFEHQAGGNSTWGIRIIELDPVTRDGAVSAPLCALGSDQPLGNPVISGDRLFVSSNLGVATYDLTELWRSSRVPQRLYSPVRSEAVRQLSVRPVTLLVEGPFAYLAGDTYRVFDLR